MLTEYFLDGCYTIIFNKNLKIKKNKVLYRDIVEILEFYKDQELNEIPVSFRNKFEFINTFCKMKVNSDKADSDLIDSLMFSEKYKALEDYVKMRIDTHVTQSEIDSHIHHLRIRKKLNGLLYNYKDIEMFLETVRDGTFESIDHAIGNYETIVKNMYTNLMEHNRVVQIEATASLDLSADSYENVFNSIIDKYSQKCIIPSGFDIFDNEIFTNHGLESSRLYIFAGGSGSGKSTIMNNIITKSISKKSLDIDPTNPNKKSVYIYITLENQIDECFLRTYQPLFDKTTRETIKDINDGMNIQKQMVNYLNKTNSKIVMKYFPAMSISTIDISMIIDEVISKYGENSIAMIAIDYIDLLTSDVKYDAYRLELGHITLSLKSLAVQYNIPIVTATQLNREIYKVQDSGNLNLGQMGESAKKIDHADFIALLVKDQVDENIVHCKIGKNRSGKSNIEVDFKVEFDKYKFLSGSISRATEKKESFGGTNLLESQKFKKAPGVKNRTPRSDLFS